MIFAPLGPLSQTFITSSFPLSFSFCFLSFDFRMRRNCHRRDAYAKKKLRLRTFVSILSSFIVLCYVIVIFIQPWSIETGYIIDDTHASGRLFSVFSALSFLFTRWSSLFYCSSYTRCVLIGQTPDTQDRIYKSLDLDLINETPV